MAPKAVLRQWQIELREKFNLSWPIYDGHKYSWYHWPGQQEPREEKVSRKDWHKAPFVIVSSHLMGEVGIHGPGPAVAQALHDAIGLTVTCLPVSPETVLAALEKGDV